MTQHTPGPITLDYEPTGFGSGKLLLDGEHGPELIGTMNGQGRYNYGQELVIRHNAHEVMLEALRGCLDLLEANESDDEWAREFAKPRADAARAALAAAEGK